MDGILELPEISAARQQRRRHGRNLLDQTEQITRASLAIASRFQRGGKMFALGVDQTQADAAHISVEFIHPVIVGKRSLPAIALVRDLAHQLRHLGDPGDIALAVVHGTMPADVSEGLRVARSMGILTVVLAGHASTQLEEHWLWTDAPDPNIVKEMHVTLYHLLWELVHLFLDHPALLEEVDAV